MNTFTTHQFQAGNSQAVRIPVEMAFPPKTELLVRREGDRIIVEPKESTLGDIPKLLYALNPHFIGDRPNFEETGLSSLQEDFKKVKILRK